MILTNPIKYYGVYFSPQWTRVHFPEKHEKLKSVAILDEWNEKDLIKRIFNRDSKKVWVNWVSHHYGVICLKGTELPIFVLIRERGLFNWSSNKIELDCW